MEPELEMGNGRLDGLDPIPPARSDAEPISHRTVGLSNPEAWSPCPAVETGQVKARGWSPAYVQISGFTPGTIAGVRAQPSLQGDLRNLSC